MSLELDKRLGITGQEEAQLADEIQRVAGLSYPHDLTRRDGQQQVAVSAILEGFRQELSEASTQGADEYVPIAVSVAERTAQVVQLVLRFSHGSQGLQSRTNVPPSLDELGLGASNVLDCYGHTHALSLCLEALGVAHGIVHVAGHAAAVVHTPTGAHFINPSNPHLSQSLDSFTPFGALRNVLQRVAQESRVATIFHAAGFGAKDADFNPSRPEYSWLNYDERDEHGDRFVMSLYGAKEGRRVLKEHLNYKRALGQRDWDVAAEQILVLGDQYPALDARDSQEVADLRSIVGHLCDQGQFERAHQVIEARFSATYLSQDARFAVAEARCQAMIASATAACLQRSSGEAEARVQERQRIRGLGLQAIECARRQLDLAVTRFDSANTRARPSGVFLVSLASQRRGLDRIAAQYV